MCRDSIKIVVLLIVLMLCLVLLIVFGSPNEMGYPFACLPLLLCSILLACCCCELYKPGECVGKEISDSFDNTGVAIYDWTPQDAEMGMAQLVDQNSTHSQELRHGSERAANQIDIIDILYRCDEVCTTSNDDAEVQATNETV